MKNLLPFLLGLLFLGVKYYNKTRKDKAAKESLNNANIEQNTVKKSSIDDLIDQLFPSPQPSYSTPPVAQPQVINEESIDWMEEKHIEEPSSIEYTDKTARKIKQNTQFELIQNKTNQDAEQLDFDLRKAIIYDAIINPPYI